MANTDKNRKDREIEVFPTNSRTLKAETLETFFYKSEWKQGIPPSLIQTSIVFKLVSSAVIQETSNINNYGKGID